MFGDFSATAVDDSRSFLTDRLGSKLFGDNIHISDDVAHPLQSGVPFDGEGVPRRKLTLVDGGVPRELAYSRSSAHRAGVEPTGHGFPLPNEIGEAPLNIVIAGGSTSIDEMIASTDRGILITRLWYIREVEPYDKIMTGMTRDGTFLIEDGKLTRGVRNLRFNQSLVDALETCAFSNDQQRTGSYSYALVTPAVKFDRFTFASTTDY
jgi:predicted Zn-dependent protease